MRRNATCLIAVTASALWVGGVPQAASADPAPAQGNGTPSSVGRDAPLDVTQRVERLGNPLAERYPDGSKYHHARCVSDLQAFGDALYVGHGDIVLNSGPTDVWYYDLKAKRFVNQGQIADEAADHYRVIGGALYLPGMDPSEDWSFGNFYRLEDGHWVKHRTFPGSLHSADIIGVGGKLFAVSAREKAPMCLMASADDGKSWDAHPVPAGNERIEGRLFVIDGALYVTATSAAGTANVYRFDGNGFVPCAGDMLPGTDPPVRNDPRFVNWFALDKATVFGGRVVYAGLDRRVNLDTKDLAKAWPPQGTLGLFVATPAGPDRFAVEKTTVTGTITDIASDDGRCYVLSYRWANVDHPSRGAISTVSASADLKTWSPLFSFHSEVFASALEVVEGDFYLGLGGTRGFSAPSTGAILKVGKEALK